MPLDVRVATSMAEAAGILTADQRTRLLSGGTLVMRDVNEGRLLDGTTFDALTKDGQDRIWFSETGPAKRLVGFDPKTEKFFANIFVSGTIRHMQFDKKTRMMWFGTDGNKVGRISLQPSK